MTFSKIVKLPKTISLGIKNVTKQLKTVWIFSSKGRIRKKIFGDIYLKTTLNLLFIKAKNKTLLNTYLSILKLVFFGILKDYFLFLEMRGTGFKFEIYNNLLVLRLGFSHLVKKKNICRNTISCIEAQFDFVKIFRLTSVNKILCCN